MRDLFWDRLSLITMGPVAPQLEGQAALLRHFPPRLGIELPEGRPMASTVPSPWI